MPPPFPARHSRGFLSIAGRLEGLKPASMMGSLYRLPRRSTRVSGRRGTGSGVQPAMVRAQARACAVSVMAGNSRRSSTAAENSPPLIEGGADRGGLSLGDNEHAGRMGVRTEGGKWQAVPRWAGGRARRNSSDGGYGRCWPGR